MRILKNILAIVGIVGFIVLFNMCVSKMIPGDEYRLARCLLALGAGVGIGLSTTPPWEWRWK